MEGPWACQIQVRFRLSGHRTSLASSILYRYTESSHVHLVPENKVEAQYSSSPISSRSRHDLQRSFGLNHTHRPKRGLVVMCNGQASTDWRPDKHRHSWLPQTSSDSVSQVRRRWALIRKIENIPPIFEYGRDRLIFPDVVLETVRTRNRSSRGYSRLPCCRALKHLPHATQACGAWPNNLRCSCSPHPADAWGVSQSAYRRARCPGSSPALVPACSPGV